MEGVVIDGGVLVSVPLGSGTADLSGNEFDTVGPFVFTGEHKYDRVILPNMCSKVCDKAFFYNESVTYLKLGSGIEKVGTYALAGWNPLTEIAVESGAVGFVAVGGVLYYGNKVVLGVNKPTIMFKENTSAIGERAFAFCDKITSLTIPETVTEIGRFAFSECMGLKSVSIPSGVDEVGYGAFFGCISVEEVSLGRGVQVLDGLSFAGMPSMVLCKIPNTIEKIWRVIGEEAFAGCSSSLFFGKTDRNGYEQIVPQLPNNNIGDLGVPVRVVFHLGGNECDFGEVATGSSFGPLIEEAAEELGLPFVTIEGWYFDDGTFEDECKSTDRVSNYKIVDGRFVRITRIDVYAKYDAEKFVITLDLGYDGKVVQSDPIPYGTTINVKDILVPYRTLYTFEGWYDEDGRELTDSDGNTWINVICSQTIYARWESNFGVYRFSIVSEEKRECSIDEVLDWASVYGPGYEIQVPGTLQGISHDDSGHEITVDFKVVSIAANVYKGCSARTVMFPASVRSIGSRCFAGCKDIELIEFASGSECHTIGARAFEGAAIGSIILPDSLRTLKQGVFLNCKNLTTVRMGGNVTSIGTEGGNSRGTFDGCDALETVQVPSLDDWMGISFGYASCNPLSNGARLYAGGSEVTTISSETMSISAINPFAFVGCPSITSVYLPNTNVVEIGAEAFSACTNLTSVTFNSFVRDIGRAAFSNTGVTYISIPETVEEVGEFMFNGCASLTTAVIECRTISTSMFSGCPLLANVTIGANVGEIGKNAFASSGPPSNVSYDSYNREWVLNGGMVVSFAPNSTCTNIDDCAFKRSGVVSAGDNGTSQSRPKGSVFLTPESVNRLGDYAFEGCNGIFYMYMITRYLDNYPANAFSNCPNAHY